MCLLLCLFIPAIMYFSFFANSYISIKDKKKIEVILILSATFPSFFVSFVFPESNPRHHIHAAVEEFRGAGGQLSRHPG